jgi:hypothetical protein
MIKHTLRDGTEIEITTREYCGHISAQTVINGKRITGTPYPPDKQAPHTRANVDKAGYKGYWMMDCLCLPPDKGQAVADMIAAAQAAQDIITARTVKIYLSSCGWGDYSACEWVGDITRPDAEILAECKHLLTTGHDIDQPNPADDELLSKITVARDKWTTRDERAAAYRKAEADDIQRKIDSGFCFACESWCHGDCGHYSSDPSVMYRRQLNEAAREANYGVND